MLKIALYPLQYSVLSGFFFEEGRWEGVEAGVGGGISVNRCAVVFHCDFDLHFPKG